MGKQEQKGDGRIRGNQDNRGDLVTGFSSASKAE